MAIFRGPNIVKSGLVLALDAADKNSYIGTGVNWNDLSGNNYNGTLTNGPTFNNSNGGSIVFDGTNDYVPINNTTALQFTNSQPYSISSWIYWTENSNAINYIFSYSTSTSNLRGYYMALDNNILRSRSFLFDYYDGISYKAIQGNANVIPANTWVNLCGTCVSNSGPSHTSKFYVNGQLTSYTDRSAGTPDSINYTSLTAAVGNRGETPYAPFKGRVSTTLVYNITLSDAEVLQNYNATKTRFGLGI